MKRPYASNISEASNNDQSNTIKNNRRVNASMSNCENVSRKKDSCPNLPGTILRINIPEGTVINLLNLIEVTSPGGICLIIRTPLFNGGHNLASLVDAIKQAGGTIEIANS